MASLPEREERGPLPAGGAAVADMDVATISAIVLRGLVEAVEQSGAARSDFLDRLGVDVDLLADPLARLPFPLLSAATEIAVELTGDPLLGLHWADSLSERTFVPISHLIAHSSSLREGLDLLAQYFGLLCDRPVHRLLEEGDRVTLWCDPAVGRSAVGRRFASEMMVGGFWRLLGDFAPQSPPQRASFAYPAPPWSAHYATFFGGAAHFAQPFTGIVFDRSLLDAASPQRDDDVRTALEELASLRLQRIRRSTPYAIRVRDHVVRNAWPHRTDMASVARELEMSVRTLRRRLAEEGTSYDEVLQEARTSIAKGFLRDPGRTIQEVAFAMGFAEASSFHRAFKRWTGTTPSAFRARELGLD